MPIGPGASRKCSGKLHLRKTGSLSPIPAQGSRHNRGCAVDLTLYELKTGKAVEMVGGYDEMSDRSYPDYPGGTARQRWHRELLRHAMEEEGFSVYEAEWWHFDYQDWRKYPILNLTFDELRAAKLDK